MHKTSIASIIASVMILTGPVAYADSIIQIWNCTMHDGKTPPEVVNVSAEWLKAAKTMEGGKDLEVFIEFPLAAQAGDGDFTFVLVVPDTKTWGLFNYDYDGSVAAAADEDWAEVASCSSSALWESIEIE